MPGEAAFVICDQSIYHYWRTWRLRGDWVRIHAVRSERTRPRAGREQTPSAGIIDSQSVKKTERGPPGSRGYDSGKKLSGRKRHLLVDTGGLVLKALVHAADITDRQGGQLLLEAMDNLATTFPRLCYLWADSASQGSFKVWVEQTLHWTVDVVKGPSRWVWVKESEEPPPVPTGFQLLRCRWVVERTFGWLGRWRRTSQGYEYLPATSECVIYLTMIRIMLRRLAETWARSLLRRPLEQLSICSSRQGVTGVDEPRDRFERQADGLLECLVGAGAQPTQDGLELGEGLLDRREVRGLGRQEEQ